MRILWHLSVIIMRRKRNADYKGQIFGELTVIHSDKRKILPSGQKPRIALCKCVCGKETEVLLLHLLRGRTNSCGCVAKTKNGESKTRLHKRWKAMIERCCPEAIDSHRYFDRGISVCDEWKDFFKFKEWALKNGYNESLTIDRIDNNKGYGPKNCRFVTIKENCSNKELTTYVEINGEKIPFMFAIDRYKIPDISHSTVRCRIKRGWDHEKAFTHPIISRKTKKLNHH